MALQLGQTAPDFEQDSTQGRIAFHEWLGDSWGVLFSHPKDFTPVCTKETCGFNAIYDELAGEDTEVIGVSVDSDDSHRKFAEKYDLKFALVSDGEKELARKYEATSLLRDLLGKTSRITYVIDKKGEIAGVFKGELSASKHVDGARDLIRKLRAASA